MISELGGAMRASPGELLNFTDFSELQRPLFKIGISLETIVNYVNDGVRQGEQMNDSSIAYNFLLQQSVESVSVILQVTVPLFLFR